MVSLPISMRKKRKEEIIVHFVPFGTAKHNKIKIVHFLSLSCKL